MPRVKADKMILAMDLSLNGSAFAVLKVYSQTVKIIEMVHVDNSNIPAKNLPEKLANIYFNLDELLQKYDITDIVKEKGFTKYNNVTQKLFRVVGIVDFTAYCNGFVEEMPEIAPTSVKKTLTGNGKASKEEVAEGILKYLTPSQRKTGVYFEKDDLSDACAVGIAHAIRRKYIPAK